MRKFVFLNVSFIDESEACVPISDRGFLYGDGLFETVRVYSGTPFRLKAHWERLACAAGFLEIALPYSFPQIERFTNQLIEKNQLPDAVLRITLSRGSGRRGYSIQGANKPTFVMSLHPLPSEFPDSVKLCTASYSVRKNDLLSTFKTANKLHHILAKTEAKAHGADEALILNSDGEVTCASSGNIFGVMDGTIFTPPLDAGILPGITRATIIELLKLSNTPFRETTVTRDKLSNCDGCFITNSVLEIVPVSHIDATPMKASPIVSTLQNCYLERVQREAE